MQNVESIINLIIASMQSLKYQTIIIGLIQIIVIIIIFALLVMKSLILFLFQMLLED